ncbi:MAG: tryptophan 2,3-dioxygenase family protein [Alphaproteobacteria bacterium]
MAKKTPWDQYGEYLHIDKILAAQHPKSVEAGHGAHDEMLFIQFHQIYELWFKQILYELDDITSRFSKSVVDENDMQPIMIYLGRIVEIFKQTESMIDVLETMPPQSFVDFREYLGTASGFQSLQFRLIETRLGLKREVRLPVFHGPFDDNLLDASKQAIKAAESKPSLFEQLDSWLSRTPFVNLGEYTFWNVYRTAVHGMFDEKVKLAHANLSGDALAAELDAREKGKQKFEGVFDEKKHAEAVKEGKWRLSWKALQAALFITIYRNEPALQAPYALLKHIMDVDELLARWRFRHALMVQRMVGMGMGTGGSSGYEYLMNTVLKHRIFSDIFALSTYLIPSRLLPQLPAEISDRMDYNYAKKA